MSTDVTRSGTPLSVYVAEEIRALMGRRQINKAEMARRLAVDETWVGRRLNGRHDFALADVERIAVILGVEASDLLPRRGAQLSGKAQRPIRTHQPTRTVAVAGQDRPSRSIVRTNRQTDQFHQPGRAVSQTRPLVPVIRPTAALAAR